jgi:hypothetical protein
MSNSHNKISGKCQLRDAACIISLFTQGTFSLYKNLSKLSMNLFMLFSHLYADLILKLNVIHVYLFVSVIVAIVRFTTCLCKDCWNFVYIVVPRYIIYFSMWYSVLENVSNTYMQYLCMIQILTIIKFSQLRKASCQITCWCLHGLIAVRMHKLTY